MNDIGPYHVISKLGDGGYATVWACREPRTGAEVAVKLLRKELITQATKSGPTPVQRFLAEAELLQRLDHPGMIKVLDTINRPQDGVVAFSMERLVGADLYQLSRTDQIDMPLLLDVVAQVATTLGHLHEHGIIHRDVKQSNIFVCESGSHGTRPVSRLLDFGIAKQVEEEAEAEHTRQGSMVGTSHLITPEVLDRAMGMDVQLTGAVDQWGLAVVLYKCLTGKFPFNSEDYATLLTQIRKWPPPVMRLKGRFNMKSVPGALDNIVRRALAKRPEERFSSAHSMSKYIARARAELFGSPAQTQGVPDSSTQLTWEGPSGPLDMGALAGHQGALTTIGQLDLDGPTTIHPPSTGPKIENALQIPAARTVSNKISDFETNAMTTPENAITASSDESLPAPPVDNSTYDDDSLATEVQFQKPDWSSHGISAESLNGPTGPISAPEEVADTRILPRYELNTFEKEIIYESQSNWGFVLILAIVFLAVLIWYLMA